MMVEGPTSLYSTEEMTVFQGIFYRKVMEGDCWLLHKCVATIYDTPYWDVVLETPKGVLWEGRVTQQDAEHIVAHAQRTSSTKIGVSMSGIGTCVSVLPGNVTTDRIWQIVQENSFSQISEYPHPQEPIPEGAIVLQNMDNP
jgi:hypothetical protein